MSPIHVYPPRPLALVIPPDGAVFALAHVPTLEQAQACVGGGYIEPIQLPGGATAFVNEDGVMKRLPVNRAASDLIANFGGQLVRPIVGPMLIVGSDGGPEWIPLTSKWIEDAETRGLRLS